MDSKIKKIVDAIEPKRSAKKRSYDVPLRTLKRGRDRKPEGHYLKGHHRPEAEQFFFSIDWNTAWQQFLQREQNGRFKHKTARQLACALSIGVDAETKRRRAGYLYRAIGPVSSADKSKQVPYLGDWDMLRSQTFLGEMKKDSLLFGSPCMKVAREAMRKHVDVMETAKACAETMLNWVARYEMWSRQVDEHYEYKLFDPKLSDKQNLQRFEQYTNLQHLLHEWQAQAVEHVLRCYGVGKGRGLAVAAAARRDRAEEHPRRAGDDDAALQLGWCAACTGRCCGRRACKRAIARSIRSEPDVEVDTKLVLLSDHPKPANEYHLKTGQRE